MGIRTGILYFWILIGTFCSPTFADISWSPISVPASPMISGDGVQKSSLEAERTNAFGMRNLALGEKAVASASSSLDGYPIHQVAHLNDGQLGNDASWVSGGEPSWAQIDLGDVYWICEVALGNDTSGQYSDRGMTDWSIQVATQSVENPASWRRVAPRDPKPSPVSHRTLFRFEPVQARYVRVAIGGNIGGAARIDEIEVYGRSEPITAEEIGIQTEENLLKQPVHSITLDENAMNREWLRAVVDEEYAWLKAFGRADLDPGLVNTPYPKRKFPCHVDDDVTTLVRSKLVPVLDGVIDEEEWATTSTGVVTVASPSDDFETGALVEYTGRLTLCDTADGSFLYGAIQTNRLLSVYIATLQTPAEQDRRGGVLCLNADGTKLVLRDYGRAEADPLRETPLDSSINADKTAFEFRIPLQQPNVSGAEHGVRLGLGIGGRYTTHTGHPVTFWPGNVAVTKVRDGFDQRNGAFVYRLTNLSEHPIVISYRNDSFFEEVRLFPEVVHKLSVTPQNGPIGPEFFDGLTFHLSDATQVTLHPFCYSPVRRTWTLLDSLIPRHELPISEGERAVWRQKYDVAGNDRERFREVRELKRRVFLSLSEAVPIGKILFEKRYPLEPTHNYSDYFDSTWRSGGGIYTLTIPQLEGTFVPQKAALTELFATTGMSRHPSLSFDATKIYFTNRRAYDDFWHVMEMNADGSEVRQLTDGPFHDLWPTPLPDGGLAMISTRCRQKFLCWRPQASVLYRMDPNDPMNLDSMKPLSFANLTEWAPSVTHDGRILWTRSEYQDKGADYGHTLWTMRPDGTMPELTFGNTIPLPQGFANGREIPDSNLLAATMISHFGDLNGPVAILDLDRGRYDPEAISTVTPEVPWPGQWARCETFREPYPISKNLILVSHSSRDRFGIFLIDRSGNRELLYTDSDEPIGSMCPIPFRAVSVPPVMTGAMDGEMAKADVGEFFVENVYAGLGLPLPSQGGPTAKYLRICQEVRHTLDQNADGTYRSDHDPFMEFYASPVDLVSGPYGWTSYVAKASWGLATVESDGSARFTAPAGKVLYFELLDEDFNEIQRMRSVVQLQPGETRGCVGCHEDRRESPIPKLAAPMAMQREPESLVAEPWGVGAFDYQKVVQPVLDRRCVSCHATGSPIDLSGVRDADHIPASYKTLIRGGYIHHFDWQWQGGVPTKAEPLSFGTVKSRLWPILEDANHRETPLTEEEKRAIRCWTDLSCPLWPDYVQRSLRKDD